MGRRKRLSREAILQQLRKFAEENGRPPKTNETGFQDVVHAAKREFGSWTHALKIAGLQTYRAWKGKRTLAGRIRALLNYNPMTLKELREELNESSDSTPLISAALKGARDINSLGPRRNRVYYLEGQKALAQTRLDEILSEIPELEEEIFYHLRQPMTRRQIEKVVLGDKFTTYKKEKIGHYLKELLLAGLLYKARFMGGKGRGRARRFGAYDLFGNLATKTFYCRFDCPNEVAQLVLKNIPRRTLQSRDLQISLVSMRNRHLKRILPKDVHQIVERELWKDFETW